MVNKKHKHIIVTETTHQQIKRLVIDHNVKSQDELIQRLINNQKEIKPWNTTEEPPTCEKTQHEEEPAACEKTEPKPTEEKKWN